MKRKLLILYNLINRFKQDFFEFSFKVALGRLVRDLPIFSWDKRRGFYEKQVYEYLKNEYSAVIKECLNSYESSYLQQLDKKYVWVMWWQGEDSMPPIVKACYSSLKRAAKQYEIVLITQENWKEYVEIPQYIVDKVENKIITLTHFSDIMRVALLEKFGGLWIDSTVYVEKLPEDLFEQEFFSLRAPGLFVEFISRGDWAPFVLGVNSVNSTFSKCLTKVFENYWDQHNQLIDYLLIDYIIKLLIEESEHIKLLIESVKENRSYYVLNTKINEEFDMSEFEELLKISPMQKLTYKKEFINYNEKGKKTFYFHLIRKEKIEFD